MSDERTTLHIKLSARLPARVSANAREEGLSRAEYVRAALAAAALKSEQQTGGGWKPGPKGDSIEPSPATAGGADASRSATGDAPLLRFARRRPPPSWGSARSGIHACRGSEAPPAHAGIDRPARTAAGGTPSDDANRRMPVNDGGTLRLPDGATSRTRRPVLGKQTFVPPPLHRPLCRLRGTRLRPGRSRRRSRGFGHGSRPAPWRTACAPPSRIRTSDGDSA